MGLFGKSKASKDDGLRTRLLGTQHAELRKLEARQRRAIKEARWSTDRAADRALMRDLNSNIRIRKANIRDLQR